MIQEKQKLSGILKNKESLNGSLSNKVIYVEPITQEKIVIPTAEQQIVTPDKEYTGLSKVIVEAIQDDNLIPENIKNGVDILGVTGNFVGNKYAPKYISFYNYKGTELNEELANLDTNNITSMYNMFAYCSNLTSLNLSNFNTSNVTNMGNMFGSCAKLTSLNLSNFNTSNVTDMGNMFQLLIKLTTLDLSNFNTSNVTNMYNMFAYCKKLTSLDLSNFNTSKVTDMGSMFTNCNNLTSLDFSVIDTSKVTNMSNMFSYCYYLTDIKGLKTDSVSNISLTFTNSSKLTNFDGLKNLGKGFSTSWSANYYQGKLDLSYCRALTEQSLINVLNNLYDIATKGCKTQQVVLGSTNLAKLTSEEGQTALTNATAKGWTVS